MTDEIICECGHAVSEHALDGCDFGKYETDCLCTFTPARIYKIETERQAARLAALTLAVGEMDMQIKKLREALSDNNAALILAAGELQQRGFHVGLVVVKMIQSARAILAETAPATEAGK